MWPMVTVAPLGSGGVAESRVHIKTVADLLGHSSIAITGDIYGHTSDATTRAAIGRNQYAGPVVCWAGGR